jgi:WhiB family redox-sensing transcriptional regulator
MKPGALRPLAEGANYTRAPAAETTDWRAQARCRDYEPELFYPFGTELQAKSAPAIRICNQCAVRTECRDWAMSHGELFGVWGGLSEIDREALRTGHRRHYPRTA